MNASELHSIPTDVLVEFVAGEKMIPTRELEELYARGDDATMRAAEGLRARVANADLDRHDAWLVLLLGLAGEQRDVVLLCDVLAGAEDDNVLRSMVTDSLARIGTAGLPEIRQRLADAPAEQRLWLYGALGWIRDAEARAILRDALRNDTEVRDVVATALGIQGENDMSPEERTAIRQELRAAFDSAEAWQRPELLDALHDFDRGTVADAPQDEDWRLRYRMNPRLGAPLPNWAYVAALTRMDPQIRALRAQLSLDPDTAPKDSAPATPHCECCDQPMWESCGVLVCRATAVSMPVLLAHLLGDFRDTYDTDDLFDVLDDVEAGIAMALDELDENTFSARAQREHEDGLARDGLMRQMAMWMVREGIETVAAARARLLAAAGHAVHLYGDPSGVLHAGTRAEPAVADARIGRNDPCPCGSGRKYKKCCGASAPS